MKVKQSMELQRIGQLKLFSGLPQEELQHLRTALTQVTYLADHVLLWEGDPGDRFYLLLEGEVEVIKALGTPEEQTMTILGPGDFLGEMSLLGEESTRSASVRTRSAATLVEMTRPEFEALIDRQPHLASRLLREMVKRLRASDNVTIQALQEKNRQLTKAYDELKSAQAQLIEKEKMETELSLARRIQENSLPSELPQPGGWHIAVNWQPARTVSGDFYDVLCGPDDNLHLLIADVTGKGVPAAMVVATARTILHTYMAQNLSPGELLGEANELLCDETPPGMFITCFYAVIEPRSGHIRFANAGHNLPYCLGRNGLRPMNARGMPLGALPGSVYEGEGAVLEPGEGLLLYSDGLVEAHDPDGEMFGNTRLETLLTGLAPDDSALDVLLKTLSKFTGDTPEQEDDITLMFVSRTGES